MDRGEQRKRSIYLLPGTMCDGRLWSRISGLLENQYNLQHIAIEKCMGIDSIRSKMAKEIPEQADVLGFSMGGYLAMEFALKYPQRIRSLVLVCVSDNELSEQEFRLRESYTQWLKHNEYGGMSVQRMQKFIHPDHYNDAEITETILAMDRELGKATLISQLQGTSHRHSLADKLGKCSFSVQIVGAEQDNFVSYERLQRMAHLMPNSRLDMVENSGHMLPLEQPAKLAGILNTFYDSFESH